MHAHKDGFCICGEAALSGDFASAAVERVVKLRGERARQSGRRERCQVDGNKYTIIDLKRGDLCVQ